MRVQKLGKGTVGLCESITTWLTHFFAYYSLFHLNQTHGLLADANKLAQPWHRCFPENFSKFFKSAFFTEHSQVTDSESLHRQKKSPRGVL